MKYSIEKWLFSLKKVFYGYTLKNDLKISEIPQVSMWKRALIQIRYTAVP